METNSPGSSSSSRNYGSLLGDEESRGEDLMARRFAYVRNNNSNHNYVGGGGGGGENEDEDHHENENIGIGRIEEEDEDENENETVNENDSEAELGFGNENENENLNLNGERRDENMRENEGGNENENENENENNQGNRNLNQNGRSRNIIRNRNQSESEEEEEEEEEEGDEDEEDENEEDEELGSEFENQNEIEAEHEEEGGSTLATQSLSSPVRYSSQYQTSTSQRGGTRNKDVKQLQNLSEKHFEKKDVEKESSQKLVTFLIDGNRFPIQISKLQAHPDTMLGRMFSTLVQKPKENGEYKIEYEIEPSLFRAILGYYDHGIVKCTNDSCVFKLLEACEYFLIPISTKTFQCRNIAKLLHYLSNVGGREVFLTRYLTIDLLPLFEESAKKGARQCVVVALYSNDELVWDENSPPPFEEHKKSVIHSSDLARFLSFAENRELAREALQERGFKKVRLGIEAFPIDLIDDPNNASPSNVYRYEQRPFIFVSWEKEEKSNRHVIFQQVRRSRRPTRSPPAID